MNLNTLYNKINNLKVENELEKEEILKELEVEILTAGKVNRGIVSTMKKIQKDNKDRPLFQGLYKTKNENHCICNGYALVDFGKNKDNIPKELLPYINKENQEVTIDYQNLKNNYANEKVEINIKNVEKVSKYNKLHKENPIAFPVGNKLINADFILDFIKLSGVKDIENIEFFIDNSEKKPMNIKFNEDINGLILPIYKKEDLKIENNKKYNEIINKGE